MKKIILSLVLLVSIVWANAQMLSPVQWTFTSKKISAKIYEVHLTATIQNGWHLYSQTQPADAINQPTEIKYSTNGLLTLDGKTKEVGKLQLMKDEKLGISANQYSGKVDFVQKIKLKTAVKTNVSGTVEFQTCDDKKCLPPKTISFSVTL